MRSRVRSKPMLAPLTALALWLGVTTGCSTQPVNPDGCRAIENARCEAAVSCPTQFPNINVDGCKRFYHDQCLHGLSAEGDPGQPRIDQCVEAINLANVCATQASETICQLKVSGPVAACDVIQHPELYKECDFLIPPPVVKADAGGDGDIDAEADAEAGTD